MHIISADYAYFCTIAGMSRGSSDDCTTDAAKHTRALCQLTALAALRC